MVWHGCVSMCGGLGCHICTAGVFFLHHPFIEFLKSGAEAAPYSATIQAWLEFPLTSGYLIFLLPEHKRTTSFQNIHIYMVALRLFTLLLKEHYCTEDKDN